MIRLLLLAACTLSAQYTATLIPLPLAALSRITGAGREAALWRVRVCLDDPRGVEAYPRERILDLFPEVRVLPNDLARDLLDRRARADRRSLASRALMLSLKLLPLGMTVFGLAKNEDIAKWSGIGLEALLGLAGSLKGSAPDVRTYFDQFLPDVLTPKPCGEWYVAAALMPSPVTIQRYVPQRER